MVTPRDPDPVAPASAVPAPAAPAPLESTGSRSDLDLARQQLQAIERWHTARRDAQSAASRSAASREARMDLARRMDVIRAEHRAIVERTDAHLRSSVDLLQRIAPRRAIVVHRNRWFTDKVCADLAARAIVVVASLSNGAEAVGATVAEQPDLLLVEDSLPMMSGEDVVREVRAFAPATRIGAHVGYDERIAAMLEAGADTAYTRRVPPADVAEGLAGLLLRSRQPA
jgi:CheY-like chemotaxis protein